MIRSKFRVNSVQQFGNGGNAQCDAVSSEQIILSPVHGEKGTSNAQWSKWTPSGEIRIHVSNPECFGKFKLNSVHFVDFTETTEDA